MERITKKLHQPFTQKELDLYLRYNHLAGHLIYYEDISDNIVIDPQWLSNLFKCIVTADDFRSSKLPKHDLEKLRTTGKISQHLLKDIFQNENVGKLQPYLMKVMEKFHLVIELSQSHEHAEKQYFAPCMVTKESFDVKRFSDIKDKYKSTWLCIECDFIPPFLFNHIIISFCEKYRDVGDLPEFYSNGTVVDILPNRCRKLVILKLKNVIQLQIVMLHVHEPNCKYNDIKRFLTKQMAQLTHRFSLTIEYNYKWKCPESFDNCSKLMRMGDCREGDIYHCKACNAEGHTFHNYWDEDIQQGQTPLHLAAKDDDEPTVLFSLSSGENVNVTDHEGSTPLHVAAHNGHEPVISALLSHGADPNVTDNSGETSLHIAINCGFIKVARLLLNNGANWKLTNSKGLTALQESALKWKESELHSAARLGIDSAISMLIQNEDQVNQKSSEGYTPLHLAAIYGSRNVTLTLLKKGALLFETDSEGNNAMELAQKNNNWSVAKLYKSILESGLPKELLYLKTQDRNSFTKILKSGFYLSFSGKIMSVGHEAVGKTAITTKLRGLNPSPKIKSTEGLHIYKAAINMETKHWICKELDIEDVAFRDLVIQPKILATTLEKISDENLDEVASTENVESENTYLTNPGNKDSCGSYDDRQETQLPRTEKQMENPILRWITFMLGLEKASISTVEEILEEAVRRGKKSLVDSLLVPIIMMDFGGQTAFYSTHQAFLSYRGIYILVIDGSKGFDEELDTEMFIPGLHGKPTSRKFTLFWVGSIESFSTETSDSFPKILVVCTHKDKVPKNEADQKVNAIFTEIKKMYEGTTTIKHLVLEHRIFLNALDPDDPDYDRLKDVLVELVCSQPTWGEMLPKAWIHLKMMINRSVEKGEVIMTMKELRKVNRKNPVKVLSEADLQLFIKMQHAQGEIIYFPLPGLRENIVISPTFLVDALRSLITDSSFTTGHRNKTVESMHKNSILKEEDIGEIWKDNKIVLQHKHYLLPLLKHLDVIAVPRNYNKKGQHVKPDFYYVPSLVKTTGDSNYIKNSDSRILGLSFKFQSKILPPVIGYRLIASCVDMFEIQSFEGQILLFSGMVVLKVKRGLDIAVFLRLARVDIFLIHANSRFQIIRDTASGIAECLKDILSRIFENYKVTSFDTKNNAVMPYTIEYPCFDCFSPCYSEDTNDWVCDHGYTITKETKENWKTDRKVVHCPEYCKGLIGRELDEHPTDLHLAKLAQQFNWDDLYKLVIRLGLTVTEVKAIQKDYGNNRLNVAFLCLRKWRLKAKGTAGDLITAIRDMDLDIHAACKMLRHRPMDEIDVSMEEPTDQLLDSIASEAITESLFLSIELGHNASLWLQMKDDKEKIVKINRKILAEWRSEHPRKDQMKDLAQALCNVGLNISTFVEVKAKE